MELSLFKNGQGGLLMFYRWCLDGRLSSYDGGEVADLLLEVVLLVSDGIAQFQFHDDGLLADHRIDHKHGLDRGRSTWWTTSREKGWRVVELSGLMVSLTCLRTAAWMVTSVSVLLVLLTYVVKSFVDSGPYFMHSIHICRWLLSYAKILLGLLLIIGWKPEFCAGWEMVCGACEVCWTGCEPRRLNPKLFWGG